MFLYLLCVPREKVIFQGYTILRGDDVIPTFCSLKACNVKYYNRYLIWNDQFQKLQTCARDARLQF